MPFPLKFIFYSFTAPCLFPDPHAIHTVEVSLSSIYQTSTCCDCVVIFQSYEFEACSKEAPDLLWLSDSRLEFMKLIQPRRHLVLSHFRWWLWVTRSDCLPFILELSYRQHYCWSYAQLRQKTFYSVSVSWDFHIGSLLWHNKLNVNFIKFAVQVFPCRVTGGYFISDLVLTHTTYSLLNVSVLSSSYSLSGGIHDRHSYRLETLYIRNSIQIWFCLAKWQNDFFFFLIAWLSATEGNRSKLLPRGFYPFCSFILYAFFHPFCR